MRKKIEFTQEQIKEMITMHENGVLNKDIAKRFNTSISTINRRLAENKVQTRHPRLSEERIQMVINLYKEYQRINAVCQKMNISSNTVHQILKDHGIHIFTNSETKTRCKINETYFDNIDSHRKAYYLGLLFADGTVHSKNNLVQISLQERDKDIIYQLQKDLECDYKISVIEYNKKNSNWQNQYYIAITNKHIHDALISHGMLPNKSLILEFPTNLPEEYYSSFILGYMDGDGNIAKNEKRISLISTEMFCKSIAQIVKEKFDIHCSIMYCHSNKNVSTRTLQIAGRKQTKIFLDWIYSECDIYLKRKYNIYQSVYCVA